MSDIDIAKQPGFAGLGLPPTLLRGLEELGYEEPSPIQRESIPPLLAGKDVLGLAQTGTGKTAAFALPILARTDTTSRTPQVLVLAPTRELAQQVAKACETYAKYIGGIKVAAVYGGQPYDVQIRAIKNGAQWIVGTPGRIMDHIKKGSLVLSGIKAVILDEADEMLRMGFIQDVDWILDKTPEQRQVALFSATMPSQIKQIASKHLNSPVEVKIESKTNTAPTIDQRYWLVQKTHKNDALLRITEVEECGAIMVFVRTKQATEEVADFMKQKGMSCEALNGDIPQAQRERVVDKLKKGQIDMIVATDVAARGLDVERITHVFNYDIPYDTESYVHRIGRTGRAGRSGTAIMFIRPREKGMLRNIERVNRTTITEMMLPTAKEVNVIRKERFKDRIVATVEAAKNDLFKEIIQELVDTKELDPVDVAAALAKISQGSSPLFLNENEVAQRPSQERGEQRSSRDRDNRSPRENRAPRDGKAASVDAVPLKNHPNIDMCRFHLDVGHMDGVKPGNIVGAIANEADIESKYIGHIDIFDHFSTVDLPDGMPPLTILSLAKVRVCGQAINIRLAKGATATKREPKMAQRKGRGDGRRGNSSSGERKFGGEERSRRKPNNRD
jgi:ATP-dependent RNA helicase DeaD